MSRLSQSASARLASCRQSSNLVSTSCIRMSSGSLSRKSCSKRGQATWSPPSASISAGWLGVSQWAEVKESGGSFPPAQAKCVDQSLLEFVILVGVWWPLDEIYQPCGWLYLGLARRQRESIWSHACNAA